MLTHGDVGEQNESHRRPPDVQVTNELSRVDASKIVVIEFVNGVGQRCLVAPLRLPHVVDAGSINFPRPDTASFLRCALQASIQNPHAFLALEIQVRIRRGDLIIVKRPDCTRRLHDRWTAEHDNYKCSYKTFKQF